MELPRGCHDGQAKKRVYAHGEHKQRHVMNQLETDYYNEILLPAEQCGKILWIKYEAIKLLLALPLPGKKGEKGVWYTPDFAVMWDDGRLEIHETKGHMREAGRVRLRIAAATYPFRFFLIYGPSGDWKVEEV